MHTAIASPRYHQVYVTLRTWVRDGTYKPGEQIPTEPQLCEVFGVSRITVRKAIDNLAKEGWLLRQQGRGTFVQISRARAAGGPCARYLHKGAASLLSQQPTLFRQIVDGLAHRDARHPEHLAELRLGRNLFAGLVCPVAHPGTQRHVDLVISRRSDGGMHESSGPRQSNTIPPERFITVPVTNPAAGLVK